MPQVAPPIVSVVIPLFNKKGTILRAIDSALSQSITDIEVIVIDDGSTDGSDALVQTIEDPRVKLVGQANSGPGRARNAGVECAQSAIIAFLDADDEWKPNYLEAGVAALNSHPDSVAYVAGYDSGAFAAQRPNRVRKRTAIAKELPPPDHTQSAAQLRSHLHALHSSSTMIRKDVFMTYGGFYAKDRCLWGEDSYLWAQILFAGPTFWDPEARTLFHVEDSDLGFAVTGRSDARPLTYHAHELCKQLPPDRAAPFYTLAKSIAAHDATALVKSGHREKAKAIRRTYNISPIRSFIGDNLRMVKKMIKG